MKKTLLLALTVLFSLALKAQDSTQLYQNFNLNDSSMFSVSGTPYYNHFPPGWSAYSTYGTQTWHWEDSYGIGNSACMHINGYSSGDHIDSNWLFTPVLDLHSYAFIYLNFSAAYYYAGDSLHVMVSHNYTPGTNPDGATWADLGHYGVMLYDTFYNIIGDYPIEFQCDLTPFKSSPCVVAFRYTSSSSDGAAWDLDSVFTGTTNFGAIPGDALGVANITKQKLSVAVLGISTPNNIEVAYDVNEGQYAISIYSMNGRKVYNRQITAGNGNQNININDANLAPGMYIMDFANSTGSGVTKFIVQ